MKGQIFAYLLVAALIPLSASVAIFALSGENQAPTSYDRIAQPSSHAFSETLPTGFQGTSAPFKTTSLLLERPTPLGTEIQDPWPDSGTGWD